MYAKTSLAVLWGGIAVLAFGLEMAIAQPDIEGTYEGVIKCDTRYSNGTKEKLKGDVRIEVSQSNGNLSMLIDDVAQFNGVVFADAKKPDKKAAGAAILCNINNDPRKQNIMLNFEVGSADELRAKIKGTSIFTFDRDEGEVGHCKFNAKRVSTDDPDVASCFEPASAE